MTSRVALAASLIGVCLIAVAGAAEACSFCGAARKDASVAYVVTAAAMGLMPIAFGMGLVLWLRGKYRRAGREDRLQEPSAGPRP